MTAGTDVVSGATATFEQIGTDIHGINTFLGLITPKDADKLTGQALAIYNASVIKFTGYQAANPAAAYKAGNGAGTLTSNLINDPLFSLQTPSTATAINAGDQGALVLVVNDAQVDSFDLAGHFDKTESTGNQTYAPANSPLGKITVQSCGVYNQVRQKVVALVNITAADLRPGYNEIKLIHAGAPGGDQVSAIWEGVWDNGAAVPAVSAVTLAVQDNSHPKYLSGVRHLGVGDSVKVGLTGTQLFKNSYSPNPLTLAGIAGVASADILPTDPAVSGVSTPPNTTDTLTLANKILVLGVAGQCSLAPTVTVTPRNPFGAGSNVASAALGMPISTLNTESDNADEWFNTETFRLPNSWNFANNKAGPFTGQWDPTAALPAGNAKVGIVAANEHGLLYNASGVDESFNRAFVSPAARGNCQIILDGVTGGVGQLGTGDINVTVQLPTQTAQLDAAKALLQSAGVGTDGNGCMAGSISYGGGNATINVDFGGRSTNDSSLVMYVRVWLRNSNRTIKNVRVVWG